MDYDPGASEVNQLNRIKLMIAVAKANLAEAEQAARAARTASYQPQPEVASCSAVLDIEEALLKADGKLTEEEVELHITVHILRRIPVFQERSLHCRY